MSLKEFLIPLSNRLHKGDCGRICVIGGSKQYHGAPYYAAIASLYTGADLASIVCSPEAAMPLKSLSPELLVYPILGTDLTRSENEAYLTRIVGKNDVFICGPGLGNEVNVLEDARRIVQRLIDQRLPLIIDGDGIRCFLDWNINVSNNSNVIITPNHRELELISSKLGLSAGDDLLCNISKRLGNAAIVAKNSTDTVCKRDHLLDCNEEGSVKRCGGQGDILTGILATLWHHHIVLNSEHSRDELYFSQKACKVLRKCAKIAFNIHGRTCSASDILESLRKVVIQEDQDQ